jgi:hypothetical protein
MNPILCTGQHVHYFTVDKRVKVLWVPWQLGSLQLFAAQHTDTTAGNISACLLSLVRKKNYSVRARIFKLLRSPRIDFNESIPPAYVAWIDGTTTIILLGSKPT